MREEPRQANDSVRRTEFVEHLTELLARPHIGQSKSFGITQPYKMARSNCASG